MNCRNTFAVSTACGDIAGNVARRPFETGLSAPAILVIRPHRSVGGRMAFPRLRSRPEMTTATIRSLILQTCEIKTALANDAVFVDLVAQAAQKLKASVHAGGTIFVCGNGGSACDAMHFVEELVARYKRERPGIKAQHFQDAATLSCWANDYDYETVFSRQVETFCGKNDVLVAISCSGNSKNVLKAAEVARTKGTFVLALTGQTGGKLAALSDICLKVPHTQTERIQESHIMLVHIFCELLET